MNALLAYCGIDCQTCPIRLATLEVDEAKRTSMRAAIAQLCNEHYGITMSPQDVTDCDGCRAGTGRLFSGCMQCTIRHCAIGRGLESCAYCEDFGCKILQQHFKKDPEAAIRLDRLRVHM
jgi:hypothetical protein